MAPVLASKKTARAPNSALSARSRALQAFSDGCEVLLNPTPAEITSALARVQARARTNLLTQGDALAVFNAVAVGGRSSAHAGVRDCPRSFNYGIAATVIVAARLLDGLIGCSIERRQALPGEKGVPPISADPFNEPRKWLNEVVSTFWTRLDDGQIDRMRQQAVAAAMELAAAADWRRNHHHGAERAAAKRRLQLKCLFRSVEPVYVSELAQALRRIVEQLRAASEPEVSWRDFQVRWPSIAARYKRDLLTVFRNGVARLADFEGIRSGVPKYRLSFTTWEGSQTVFAGTQLVVQVCSAVLSTAEGAGHPSTFRIRNALRELAEGSLHPVTPDTVGWLRVHVDDHNRLAFVDEVQSDAVEALLQMSATPQGQPAKSLLKKVEDWQVHGFSSVRQWATSIGYRVAIHSEDSAAQIAGKTRSARKWGVYYAMLIKRFALRLQTVEGYPAAVWVEAPRSCHSDGATGAGRGERRA